MNQSEPNITDTNSADQPKLTPHQKRVLREKYEKLLSLIPHGKHKGRRGTKGAFGNCKRLARK